MTMKARRFVLWGILGGALTAGLVFAFRPQSVLVDFAVLSRGPLVVTIDEEGETRVRDVFVLSAPVTGRLRRIESDVGDQVIAGLTVVASIEPIDPAFLDVRGEAQAQAAIQAALAAEALAEAEVQEARAEFEFAGTELKRARSLIRKGTISQRALDNAERAFKTRDAVVATAKAGLRMREFELDQARAQLMSPVESQRRHGECDCVPIAAPVSGRILRVLQESEGVVQAGTPLVEIGNPSDLEIVADLLSEEAVKVAADQPVIIEQWGGEYPLAGHVRRVEPYGFTKTSALGIDEQRVNVIIDFDEPYERRRRLGHGYRVEVRIVLWEGAEVLKLPITALFRDGGRWAVFVEEGGRARRKFVELGHRSGLEAEITGGLDAGARIVLHPNDRIVDDVRLAPRS